MDNKYLNEENLGSLMRFKLILLMFFLLSVTLVSANAIGERLPATVGEEYIISQPCVSCSFVLISVFNTNGIVVENVNMVENGSTWTYTFTPTEPLRYDVNGLGDINGANDSFAFYFHANPSGTELTGAVTGMYLGVTLILLALLVGAIYAFTKSDNFGWKMGLLSFAYILSNGFFLVCWKLSELFLTAIPFLTPVFKVLYIASTAGYFPFFLFLVLYYIVYSVNEKRIKQMMNRGFTEDQARTKK